MNKFTGWFKTLAGVLRAAPPTVYPQPKLVQTINLRTWTGAPIPMVQPLPPRPIGYLSSESLPTVEHLIMVLLGDGFGGSSKVTPVILLPQGVSTPTPPDDSPAR